MNEEEEKELELLYECEDMARVNQALKEAQGLVFDCDGTLLDTMPIYFQSWSRACDELGLSLPIERFYSFAGVPVHDIFQTLIDEQLSGDKIITADYCEQVKRRHHDDLEKEGLLAGPIDIVVDLARRYHGKIPMAVASSGWRDHVIDGLERNGLLHLFDIVVTTEDGAVQSPKPAPDIFLVAAQRIGVCPTKCIGFEDADLGMQAVKTANYLYASDVRLMHMYPRNVEKRNSTISDNEEKENGDDAS
mmetsp:Transcript_7547/g.13855  ORF Transcript_7547/g.13855 Transcript_7547/m.13855 type:complete len:248 (-) Transcript_7547:61-804(-)|eukprot:CAMPEP_0202496628 /NCGR_PEP_ID=MMETSP1361-20130828/20509_1 /ASSEMBLY_ACC=CAM_ASM_000849 /TAXON_ID=210615 /ORGANISM="Staurosira complex sp., Strain CCMP2646" /LENGTH=247 /DNA_ID=CAMNT_0049128013 /DNA_START=36 /DNA_END=782 /DNA_ORIENTATION=-